MSKADSGTQLWPESIPTKNQTARPNSQSVRNEFEQLRPSIAVFVAQFKEDDSREEPLREKLLELHAGRVHTGKEVIQVTEVFQGRRYAFGGEGGLNFQHTTYVFSRDGTRCSGRTRVGTVLNPQNCSFELVVNYDVELRQLGVGLSLRNDIARGHSVSLRQESEQPFSHLSLGDTSVKNLNFVGFGLSHSAIIGVQHFLLGTQELSPTLSAREGQIRAGHRDSAPLSHLLFCVLNSTVPLRANVQRSEEHTSE